MSELEADFHAALRVAGITIPPARMAAMLEAYRAWRDLATVLDEPMPYAVEPAAALHLALSPAR